MAETPQGPFEPLDDLWRLERLLFADNLADADPVLAPWVAAVRAPATTVELADLPRYVKLFADTRSRPEVVRRHRPTKVAVLAAAAVLTLGGTAAAAYTGVLPGPIQAFVHDHLGALAPASPSRTDAGEGGGAGQGTAHPPNTTAPTSGRPTAAPSGGLATPQVLALCRDFLAQGLGTSTDGFRVLGTAAGKAQLVRPYCLAQVRAADGTGQDGAGRPTTHPSGKPTTNPGNKPSAHPSGKPSSHGGGKPTTTPTHSPHGHGAT